MWNILRHWFSCLVQNIVQNVNCEESEKIGFVLFWGQSKYLNTLKYSYVNLFITEPGNH
jgi:hypothetical protein